MLHSRAPSTFNQPSVNFEEQDSMKTALLAIATAVALGAGITYAEPVHDWHDLDRVHNHVIEAMHEMDRARAANHYDMQGHGAKAEAALHEAERELRLAIEAARGSP
jgi:hypothetical protein